jgi:polar amino acid transport system permease protein
LSKRKKRITWMDALITCCILAAGAYLFYRVRVGLHYRWDWGAVPQYLFRFDAEKGRWVPNLLMQGLFTTIRLSIWGTILATIIGTLIGLFRTSRGLFKRLLGWSYVELTRNIPPSS